jgi:hypothetical protein
VVSVFIGKILTFMGSTYKNFNVWALLIGINAYPQAPLGCAVEDAKDMDKYLRTELSVPPENIIKLLADTENDKKSDNYPNRENILNNLWSLAQRENIRSGDLIIVFYAGHGTMYDSGGIHCSGIDIGGLETGDWQKFSQCLPLDPDKLKDSASDHRIKGIAPADRGLRKIGPTYGGRQVPDICDREINTILSYMHRKTGANIIVIADCCHLDPVDGTSQMDGDITRWRIRGLPPLSKDALQEMLLRAEWNIIKNIGVRLS